MFQITGGFKNGKKTISVSVDEETKEQAAELFNGMGIDMSTACNVFLHKCVQEQGMPFDMTASNMINGGLDFFKNWSGVNILEYDGMQQYLDKHNINPRNLKTTDFLRIMDAMSCVAGQCGLFRDDEDAVRSLWNLMMGGKKIPLGGNPNVKIVAYDPDEYVHKRYLLSVPASRRNNMVEYVVSPYVSYLLDYVFPRDNWPEGNPGSAIIPVEAMHLMSGYLETAAHEAGKAQGNCESFWMNTMLDEANSIERALNKTMNSEDLLEKVDCCELRARYKKAIQSAPHHPYTDKYGYVVVEWAISNILSNGYKKYAEGNSSMLGTAAERQPQKDEVATADITSAKNSNPVYHILPDADFPSFANSVAVEMCKSQDPSDIFKIIADELGYIPR